MVEIAQENHLGVVFLSKHPDTGLGRSRQVNLWIRDQSPHWRLSFKMANVDLPLLTTLMLNKNWNIKLRLISLVSESSNIENARKYLTDLMTLARMPKGYSIIVEQEKMSDYIEKAPHADLNIFGLAKSVDKKAMEDLMHHCESTCFFVKDSGHESVLV